MNRRRFLTATAATSLAAVASAATAVPGVADEAPVALVYRGPASCPGCSEAVAALLASGPTPLRPVYCGPREAVQIGPEALAGATVYAQPGGGEVGPAWRKVRKHADDIRSWVRGGGHYLGFCLGGYLAGAGPGFDLLPGNSDQYVTSPGADIRTLDDTVAAVTWRGRRRHLFFQDGALFRVDSSATVLATYATGAPAAVVAPYGAGRVGVVGPHPEADASWYADGDVTNPDGIRFDLGHDLVTETLRR